jgi:hypothetical protein
MNASEFVYVYFNGGTYKYEMRIYNLQTGEDNILLESSASIYYPIWTVSGWIYFTSSLKLYRIDELGANLSLVDNNYSRLISYDATSDILIYTHIYSSSTPYNQRYYYFVNGSEFEQQSVFSVTELDTIMINQIINWDEKTTIVYTINNKKIKIFKFNLINKTKELICNLNYDNFLLEVAGGVNNYSNSINKLFMPKSTGLFVVVLNSCKISKIKNACPMVYYINISVSPDGNTILADRVEWVIKGVDAEERYRIVQLNIDGSEERIILD